jgi:hypothetical protein
MSMRESISYFSRHGSPALDDSDLPELQCACHEPAMRHIYYTENNLCLCFLKCNVPEVIFLLCSYIILCNIFKTFFNCIALTFLWSADTDVYVGMQFVNPGEPSQEVC